MPYVQVPKIYQSKDQAGLQLNEAPAYLFLGRGGGGNPVYLLTRPVIGSSPALFLMIGLMLPFFSLPCLSVTASL